MTQSGFIPPSLPSTPPTSSEPAKEKAPPPQTNVRETIESIVVAFILAFIFRAFVVEAFVIPTGSMAPTLLGAHMKFYCPDCGYEFTTNYSALGEGDDAVESQRRQEEGDRSKSHDQTGQSALKSDLFIDGPGHRLHIGEG